MKATDLLKLQHAEIRNLFARIEAAEGPEIEECFEEVAKKIVGHDVIERELFYPACERVLGRSERLGEAIVEHGVIEFSLYRAEQSQGDDDFDYRCKVLRETIEYHAGEEEKELFSKLEQTMEREELDELGARMAERFDQIIEDEDFRPLLRAALLKLLPGGLAATRDAKAGRGRSTAQVSRRDPEQEAQGSASSRLNR